MATLDRLLRRAVRGYLPFTQKRYSGFIPGIPPSKTGPFLRGSLGPTRLGPARRFASAKTNANLLPLQLSIQALSAHRPRTTLSMYEDRRRFHPAGVSRPLIGLTEARPRVVANDYPVEWPEVTPDIWRKLAPKKSIDWKKQAQESLRFSPVPLSWEDPWRTIICLKRKIRREVMHALGMAGKTGFKKPKFTQYSYVRCW